MGLIPGLERSPGGGHGNPFQYSCLENPMDRGAWQVPVHRVAKSQTTEMPSHVHNYLSQNFLDFAGVFQIVHILKVFFFLTTVTILLFFYINLFVLIRG